LKASLHEIVFLEEILENELSSRQEYDATPTALIEAGKAWSLAVWNAAQEADSIQFTELVIQKAISFLQRPVFICGSERSGTTLIRNLLDGHPQLLVLPCEGTFIHFEEPKMNKLPPEKRSSFLCQEWLWRLVTSMHVPPYWLLGRSTASFSAYVEFARAFIAWWDILKKELEHKTCFWPFLVVQMSYATSQNKLSELDALQWVEKTPYNELYFQRLISEFPQAKMIQTIRNPVDVINSRKPFAHISSISLETSVRLLQKSFKIAYHQTSIGNPNYLLLTYDSIVKETTAIMKKTALFLGIYYQDILLHPTVANKPAEANSSFKQLHTVGTIISDQNRNKTKLLTQKDQLLLSAYLFKLARKFNYQLQPIGILQEQQIKVGVFFRRLLHKIKRTVFTKH
jgi:hypothetical protein